MNIPAPTRLRCGDYARSYPGFRSHDGLEEHESYQREGLEHYAADMVGARETMKRQGCKSIRFELLQTGQLVAHGYVGRMSGPNVEDL